jgi:hypothetical protein
MRVLRLLAIAVSAAWLLAGSSAFAQAPACEEASPLYIGGPTPGVCCPGSGLDSASSPGTIMPGGGSAFGGALGSYTMAGSGRQPNQAEEVCTKPEGTLRGSCGVNY